LGEILECGATDNEVDSGVADRQSRSIAELEPRRDPRRRSITARNLDEAPADIDRPYFEAAPGKLDRETGPGATSSTVAEAGTSAAIRAASCTNSGMSLRVALSYQRATPPSIPIPLYAFTAYVIVSFSMYLIK